jgi:hypothetical protein
MYFVDSGDAEGSIVRVEAEDENFPSSPWNDLVVAWK